MQFKTDELFLEFSIYYLRILTETVESKTMHKEGYYYTGSWKSDSNIGWGALTGQGRAHNLCHCIYVALNKLLNLSVPVCPLHGVIVRINEFIH